MDSRASTVILVPVLGRPHRVQPLLESIEETTPEPHRVLFIANHDDSAELAAIQAAGADVLPVAGRGTYPEKINAGYRATEDPLLFLAADDLRFHPGWLTAAQAPIDDGALVVGTNDLGNERVMAGEHATHSLVARSYCDKPGGTADAAGTVLHEGYRHWYCDDELVGMAKKRGVWAHAADSWVEHLHPYWAKGDHDMTYRKGERWRPRDRGVHLRRRTLWT